MPPDPAPAIPASASPALLVNIDEAAALLGVCTRTVWSLARCEALPSRRIGRRLLFSPAELEAWVAAGAPTAPGSAVQIQAASSAASAHPGGRR